MAASGRHSCKLPDRPTFRIESGQATDRRPAIAAGREFAALAKAAIAGMKPMFDTKGRTSPRGPNPSPRADLAGNAGAEPAREVAQ